MKSYFSYEFRENIENRMFTKASILEMIANTLSSVIQNGDVDANTTREECKDFDDAYQVGRIHTLISIMNVILLIPENEKEKKKIEKMMKEAEIITAQEEAKGETIQ